MSINHNRSVNCFICGSEKRLHFPRWYTGNKFANLYRYCCSCGLVYQELPLSREEVFKFYTSRKKTEEKWRQYSNKKELKSFRDYQRIVEVIGPDSFRNICRVGEIGANDGALLTRFREAGQEIHGVEPCQDLVNIACRKYGVSLKNSIFDDQSFKRKSLDLLLELYVLEHVPNPGKAVQIAWDTLCEGGLAYFEVPSVFENTTRIYARPHLTLFSPKSLERLFGAGFDVLFIGSRAYAGGRNSGLEILVKKVSRQNISVSRLAKDHYSGICWAVMRARVTTSLRNIGKRIGATINNYLQ
jgi:hypothetical protein